jgi:pimeloyl-ACP methyl ester carboxylesterase
MGVGDGVTRGQDVSALIGAVNGQAGEADVTARLFHRMSRADGNDPAALTAFLRRRVDPLTDERLRQADCSVLFLIGSRDPAGVPEHLAATMPRARTRSLPGADHFSTLTDPRAVDAALRFLAE